MWSLRILNLIDQWINGSIECLLYVGRHVGLHVGLHVGKYVGK